MDGTAHGIMYAFKFVRAMVFWVALYVMEKVYQDAYVQAVLVEGKPPPKLAGIVATAVGIEFGVMLVMAVVLMLVESKYKTGDNTFVLDDRLIATLAKDYVVGTVAILAVGTLIARAAENGRLFRYKDDGLRGIRALCNMVLYVSFVVFAIPFYAL
jgi:hypothetical protein